MKTTASLLPLAVTLCALLSQPRTSAATKPSADYQPLAEGVEWTMDFEMTADDGRRVRGSGRRVVGPAETRDGKSYYRVRTWVEAEGLPRQERVTLSRKDEAGFHTIYLPTPGALEEPEVVFPMKVGARWKTKHFGGMPQTHEVKGVETVIIGAKTYVNCYHVRTTADDGSYVEDYWDAPGVGSVKSEMRFRGGKIVLTLRDFKAAKASPK